MLRRTAVVGTLMLSTSALSCSLTGLEHPLAFAPDDSALATTEIVKLAQWNVQIKEDFPGGGKYRVALRQAAGADPASALTVPRLESIQAALASVGIEGDKVAYSEVDALLLGTRGKGGNAPAVTAANVGFQPPCPHPCCLGPTPIAAPDQLR